MSNSSTINVALKIDDKGGVRVLQNVGKESTSTGKKGKKAFNEMDQSAKSFTSSAKMSANTMLKMGAGVVGIMGLAKAWGALKGAAKEYMDLASEQESAERRLGSVLKATGEAAGYNLDQLKAMASGLQDVTRIGDETTLAGMAILATFKQVRGEGFERATVAAMDMSEVMGTDLKSSILQIGKALNDPTKGMSALSRAGVTFTKSQEDTIKTLQKSGDMIGAQNLILKELESQFGGAAKAASKDFAGGMIQAQNALGDTKEEMGFVITKNQFFIELTHMATEEFKRWGEETKKNSGYLMDLAKNGVLTVVSSLKAGIETMRFFQNGWLGIKLVGQLAVQGLAMSLDALYPIIRSLLAPLDALYQGMVKLGVMDVNPFDAIGEGLATFKDSSAQVTKDVQADIDRINKKYDTGSNTLKGYIDKIKKIPVAVTEASEIQKNAHTARITQLDAQGKALDSITGKELKALQAANQEKYKIDIELAKQIQEDTWLIRDKGLKNALDQHEDTQTKITQMEYDESQKRIKQQADAQEKATKDFEASIDALSGSTFSGQSFGNELADGINNAIISMQSLNDMFDTQAKKHEEINRLRAEANIIEDLATREKALGQLSAVESGMIEDQVSGYRQMFGTTAQLFEENSKERQTMHNIEMGFAAVELAMNLKKAISNAIVSVTSSGQGDPYTAIPRVIAMAALMGGMLSQIGGSIGGGGGSSSVPLKAQNTTGSILGDSKAASGSIENTQAFFENMHLDEYTELQGIHDEMMELNSNITGLVSNIFRSGTGFSPGDMGISLDGITNGAEGAWNDMVDFVTWGEPISKWVGNLVGSLIGNIFGGDVRKEIGGQGITAGPISIGGLQAGGQLDAKSYADITTVTDGGWFSGDDYSYSRQIQDLGEDVDRLFTNIFSGLGDSFVSIAEIIGQDMETVKTYVFEIGDIDLKNLTTADEINEALNTAISGISDEAAADLFGALIGQYQKVGEGMLETAVRVATEKVVVSDSLSKIGIAFNFSTEDAIKYSQSIIALTGDVGSFQKSVAGFYDAFHSEFEKQTDFKGLASAKLGDVALPETAKGFRDLVASIDVTDEAGQKLFATLMGLASGADGYYKYLESVADFNTGIQDIINQGTLSDYEYQLLKLDQWYEQQKIKANELGISHEKLTQAYDIQKAAIVNVAAALSDIDYSLLTMGMSDFEKSVYSLGKTFEKNIDAAVALGATQNDLAKISLLYNEDLKRMLSDITSNINAELAKIGMTTLESSIYDIKKQYQDSIDQIGVLERAIAISEAQLLAITDGTSEVTIMSSMVESYLNSIESILASSGSLTAEELAALIKALTPTPAPVLSEFEAKLAGYDVSSETLKSDMEALSAAYNAYLADVENYEMPGSIEDLLSKYFDLDGLNGFQEWLDSIMALIGAPSDWGLGKTQALPAMSQSMAMGAFDPADFIKEWFNKYLMRDPAEAGLKAWTDFYNKQIEDFGTFSLEDFAEMMRRGAIDAGDKLANPDIIDDIENWFLENLERMPKEAGLEYWAKAGLVGQELYDAMLKAAIANGELGEDGKLIPGGEKPLIPDPIVIPGKDPITPGDAEAIAAALQAARLQELYTDFSAGIQKSFDELTMTEFEKKVAVIDTSAAAQLADLDTFLKGEIISQEEYDRMIGMLDALTEDAFQTLYEGFFKGMQEEFDKLGMTTFEKNQYDLKKDQDAVWDDAGDKANALTKLNRDGFLSDEDYHRMLKMLKDVTDAQMAALEEQLAAVAKAKGESLQGRIWELEGNDEAVLKLKRDKERASVLDEFGENSGFLALLEEIYKLEDAARKAAEAEAALNTAKSDYMTGLEKEIAILEGNLNDARSTYLGLLNDELSAQEQLASTLESAIESLKDYRKSLWVGDSSPYGLKTQKDMLSSQMDSLIAKAMGGDTEAISELIGISDEYLGVSKQTQENWIDYAIDVAKTNKALESVEESAKSQLTEAEKQIRELQSIIYEVNGVAAAITDMDEARTVYEAAQLALDESGYQAELDALQDMALSIDELKAAYLAALANMPGEDGGESEGGEGGASLMQKLMALVGDTRTSGDNTFYGFDFKGSTLWSALTNQSEMERIAHALGLEGYAAGGIASGPKSGYPVMLHDTEAIIPLAGGSIPVHIKADGYNSQEEVVTELRALRKEVAKLSEQSDTYGTAIARHTSDTAGTMQRIDIGGLLIREAS